jgi:hypothetical protein
MPASFDRTSSRVVAWMMVPNVFEREKQNVENNDFATSGGCSERNCIHSRSIRLLRLRIRRALRDMAGSSSLCSAGNGGSSSMGSRSLAPRAINFFIGVRGCGFSIEDIEEGIGGISGVGRPMLEVGRDGILEFRRSLFVVENEVGGAV